MFDEALEKRLYKQDSASILVLAKDVLKSLETEISEALQTRKRSSRLQQLLEWAEAIGKSSRITEAERKRTGKVPEMLTAKSRSKDPTLEAAESDEQTASPMEGIAGVAGDHCKISPFDSYYSGEVIRSWIQPVPPSTSSQPLLQEADQEMASASSRGASPS